MQAHGQGNKAKNIGMQQQKCRKEHDCQAESQKDVGMQKTEMREGAKLPSGIPDTEHITEGTVKETHSRPKETNVRPTKQSTRTQDTVMRQL